MKDNLRVGVSESMGDAAMVLVKVRLVNLKCNHVNYKKIIRLN